jgi:Fic family protein
MPINQPADNREKMTGNLQVYRQVTAVEPLLPSASVVLQELALTLTREAGALSQAAHAVTRATLAEVLRLTNSYYSHLIEGHFTSPVDIARAVQGNFSRDPAKRDLQRENVAHIATQRALEERLRDGAFDPTSVDAIRWMHAEFYRGLPKTMWVVKARSGDTLPITPGDFRTGLVDVGEHLAPAPETVPAMLAHLQRHYAESRGVNQIVAIAAMHHRLLWVHPFDDGNGRVARLVAHAQIVRAGLDAGGLWSISRGLARNRERYRSLLAAADAPRQSDTDGRGNLSERALADFCTFFLSTMLDQVQFMRACLDFDRFTDRLRKHVQLSQKFGKAGGAVELLLREAWARGAFPRGDAASAINASERTARDLLKATLAAGLLISDTDRGPVRLGFPPEFVEDLFPRLYAPGQ